MHPFRIRLWFSVLCAMLLAPIVSGIALGDEMVQDAHDLRAKYAAEIERLAAWCDENGLDEEARATRRVLGPSDPHKLFVPILSEEIGPPKLPADASKKVVEWDTRLWRLRRAYADSFFDLARRAIRTGRAGLAFELALASIEANPDYEPARRLFGYQKYRNQWRTIYEVRKLRSGAVWSDKFGWLPKGRLAKYEEGQRYDNGRWITAEEDAKRHADINSGWKIDTEHYSILTNHSIEAAVALGVKLEQLHRLWAQLFLRYYASQADVAELFNGRSRPGGVSAPRLNIVYFRDRDDYNRALRPSMPNIGLSCGVYVEGTRCAYFFAGTDSDERTMFHEATHQLFHQSRRVARNVGGESNFWIVEGIAMFMESLRREDGYYVLGGFEDARMKAARYRLLHDDFYVPLSELIDISLEGLQKDPRIGKLYSQSAGLTNFLVFYDDGRYRDAVVSYLMSVYTGRADHGTLSRLTGTNYTELDKQYREYLKGEDKPDR